MLKSCIVVCLIVAMTGSMLSFIIPIETKQAKITNGLINVTLYLPDTINGFYRGARFDWSGVIPLLEYNGHSYYGQWFKEYSPTNHDAVMGPVESFDPVGYDQAKAGESFIKIGIGTLVKPNDSSYDFVKPYVNLNPGKWKVKTKSDEVQFLHTLHDKEYSYEYEKTIKLVKDKPIMVLAHSLKNTGKQIIETQVFDHNFFVIDKQPTGPGFVITFPFELTEKINNGKEDYVKFQGNKMLFLKELNKKFISFKDLTSGEGADRYYINIENYNTGAGVRITGDRPISKLPFWSSPTTACPEPYIKIKVDPGQVFTWKITYDYYTLNTSNSLKTYNN